MIGIVKRSSEARKELSYYSIAVSVIFTFENFLQVKDFLLLPSINPAIITLIIRYKIFSQHKNTQRLADRISRTPRNRLHVEEVLEEELLRPHVGCGEVYISIKDDSKMAGLPLSDAGFKDMDLIALLRERHTEVIRVLEAHSVIHAGVF